MGKVKGVHSPATSLHGD